MLSAGGVDRAVLTVSQESRGAALADREAFRSLATSCRRATATPQAVRRGRILTTSSLPSTGRVPINDHLARSALLVAITQKGKT
jgi:hypothetical protein